MTQSSCWARKEGRVKLEIRNEELVKSLVPLPNGWGQILLHWETPDRDWTAFAAHPPPRTGLRWESLGDILQAAMNTGSGYITAIFHLGFTSRNVNYVTFSNTSRVPDRCQTAAIAHWL